VVRAIVASEVSNSSGTLLKAKGEQGTGRAVRVSSAVQAECAACQRTATLASILDELGAPRVIEYASIDVEGYEDAVLVGFPFHRYRFLSLTVERPSSKLQRYLSSSGYRYALTQGWFGDALYLHTEFPGGWEQARLRAQASSDRWLKALHSTSWRLSPNRTGTVSQRHTQACCGVPASFVRSGQAMPVPSPDFEGVAPSACICAI